jgi:hypothetical protein
MSSIRRGASVAGVKTFAELLEAWARAEGQGDAAALDRLLAPDFRGDGPSGFVLDRAQWLDRYRRSDPTIETFDWSAADVRVVNHAAVAVGIQTRPGPGRHGLFRGAIVCTLVAIRRAGRWAVVNVQLGHRPPAARFWPPGRCLRRTTARACRS